MPLTNTFETPNDQISHSTVDLMDENMLTSDQANIPPIDDKERKQFNLEIHRFMADIGKPLSKIPIMGYKELDLYQLFKEVTAHGGFNEVVKNVGTWSKIWKRLGNFDPSITDSSFRLKKNYERYLLEYEFKCYPEHRLQAMELSEKSSMKRSSSLNSISTISRPHSPTGFISSSVYASSSFLNSHASNTSFNSLHHSPEGFKKDKYKLGKKKHFRKSSNSGLPSRSQSYNNLASMSSSLSSTKMPLILGDLTIENLGVIIPRFPYVVEGNIYPVGFTSHRYFTSRINPEKQVRYTSQIVDVNERPQFVVTAADDPEHPVISQESPSDCWKQILQSFVNNDDESPNNNFSLMNSNSSNSLSSYGDKLSVSGRMRFGLTHPEVRELIKDMPNYEMIGPQSPFKRKYNNISDDSDDSKMRTQVNGPLMRKSRTLDQMDQYQYDLESAVATLQALKYCSVY